MPRSTATVSVVVKGRWGHGVRSGKLEARLVLVRGEAGRDGARQTDVTVTNRTHAPRLMTCAHHPRRSWEAPATPVTTARLMPSSAWTRAPGRRTAGLSLSREGGTAARRASEASLWPAGFRDPRTGKEA